MFCAIVSKPGRCAFLFSVEDAGSEGRDGSLSVRRTAPPSNFCGHQEYFFGIKLFGKTVIMALPSIVNWLQYLQADNSVDSSLNAAL